MTDGVAHVIDDDPAMRDSLAFLLDTAGVSVRAYESAEAFLDHATALEPGCIVTDVRMPGMTGIELIAELKTRGINPPVVVMTGNADVPLAIQAMKAGVVDFIEKPFDDEALLAAVREGLAPARGRAAHGQAVDDARARLATLSGRERDVLKGLIGGQPNKIIACELGISPRTVEIYRANVMDKTGAGSLSQLVRMSLLAGFET